MSWQYLRYALDVPHCRRSDLLMLKQVFARDPGQQANLLRLRHPRQQAVVPEAFDVQVDAEGTEEALAIHEGDRDPDSRGDEGSLGDRAEHVAQDGRILAPLPGRSVPFLRQHRHIVVQHEAQHEEPYGWDNEEADAVAVVVLGHAGAAELEGRIHLCAGQRHDPTDAIHERFLVGLQELEHHTELIHLCRLWWMPRLGWDVTCEEVTPSFLNGDLFFY